MGRNNVKRAELDSKHNQTIVNWYQYDLEAYYSSEINHSGCILVSIRLSIYHK